MPKVFISYSWEDEAHKQWVKSLTDRLIENGIDATLDQYDLTLGERLPVFMEQSITTADYVLIICTPTYKEKADNRKGGVGYEGHIISGELFAKGNERKFIPVIPKSPLVYKGGEPLRPCSGNITVPYWWTDIKFSARYFEEEEENEELAENFGFKIYVNNNELELTTENTITPSSSANYKYWLSSLNPDIFLATGDRVSAKGVYGSLSVDKHNTMNQYGKITEKYHEFTLRLLFVDLYSSNDFMIRTSKSK